MTRVTQTVGVGKTDCDSIRSQCAAAMRMLPDGDYLADLRDSLCLVVGQTMLSKKLPEEVRAIALEGAIDPAQVLDQTFEVLLRAGEEGREAIAAFVQKRETYLLRGAVLNKIDAIHSRIEELVEVAEQGVREGLMDMQSGLGLPEDEAA